MALLLPKIVYDAGAGAVTLSFSLPPVMKPAVDPREYTRTDTDAYAGQRQSVYFRSNIFKTLEMTVPVADMAAWTLFLDYAGTGGVFDYYPDATVSGGFTQYTLDDKKWDPKKIGERAVMYNKFTLRLRQYVA